MYYVYFAALDEEKKSLALTYGQETFESKKIYYKIYKQKNLRYETWIKVCVARVMTCDFSSFPLSQLAFNICWENICLIHHVKSRESVERLKMNMKQNENRMKMWNSRKSTQNCTHSNVDECEAKLIQLTCDDRTSKSTTVYRITARHSVLIK